jgi:protein-S-isoprenylcysteine O-methyltransferase Ste14
LIKNNRPQIAVKPPILFGGALLLGCLLTWLIPVAPGLAQSNYLALATSFGLVAAGAVLMVWAARNHVRTGGSFNPLQPSTALVTTGGPYAVTRNPIYIGFALVYFGLAIALTSIWMLVLLIPALFILQRGVKGREEAYLEREFGEAYRKYKARVPRWL